MRIEEKHVDGLDLEHTERQQQQLLGEEREATARTEGELPELGTEEMRDIERERGSRLIDAMRQILSGAPLKLSELGLPAREEKALEALQSAMTGRDATNMFVYAEDRRSLLEQALAVLQPNLTSGKTSELNELARSMDQLTRNVSALREALGSLEDAQDELLADEKQRFLAAAAAEAGDKDDKPKPKPSDPDAPRPASTLSAGGPDATKVVPPSTLSTGGPEARKIDAPSTLSTGGPEVRRVDAASSLSSGGPEAKKVDAASTLSTGGPEVKEEAKPASTLGEQEEIKEAAKKKPWWRRPFG